MDRLKTSEIKTVKKIEYIEYIRAFATIAVVAIHTINSGIIYSGDNYSPWIKAIFLGLKNIIYWAVPCFLIITGYLLLDPKKEISLNKLYGKYVLRMTAVIFTFGLVFCYMELIFSSKTISVNQLPTAFFNALTGNTWAHLWYIYSLIGLYLLLPLYKLISKYASDKELIYILTVLLVFEACIPILNYYINDDFGVICHFATVFPLYLLLGEVRRRKLLNLNKKWSSIIFTASTLLIFGLSVLQVMKNIDLSVWFGYSSVLTVIMAYSLFLILEKVNVKKKIIKKIILEISDKSFAIYIIHMVFVNLEYQFLHLKLLSDIKSLLIIFVLIVLNFIASYIVAFIMKKIPLINKVL